MENLRLREQEPDVYYEDDMEMMEEEEEEEEVPLDKLSKEDFLSSIEMANIPHMEAKFEKACKQLILLNNWIRAMNARYQRALKGDHRNWRFLLRLRLCTVEGMRNMFHEYATKMADRLDRLEDETGMTTGELVEAYNDA